MTRISILKRPLPTSQELDININPDVETESNLTYFQNKFQKRTAKGTVSTIVRERYLRDHIPCGSAACNKCKNQANTNNVLLGRSGLKNQKVKGSHYLVLDTNVILHQVSLPAFLYLFPF